MGAKTSGVELIAPPQMEAKESFSAKVITETRRQNVKELSWEGLG